MKNLDDEQNFVGSIIAVWIKQRWFSGRIVACHAIEPGSIHGRCKAAKQKILPEKRKLKFFQFFTVPLSKKRKLPKYSAEFKTSIRVKQSFNNFVQSFDEKIGLKSKTLFKRLKQYKSSICVSVVELSPATRQTRVRFPASAMQESRKIFSRKAQS